MPICGDITLGNKLRFNIQYIFATNITDLFRRVFAQRTFHLSFTKEKLEPKTGKLSWYSLFSDDDDDDDCQMIALNLWFVSQCYVAYNIWIWIPV